MANVPVHEGVTRHAVNAGAHGIAMMALAALARFTRNALDAGADVARGMMPPDALARVACNVVSAGAGVARMMAPVALARVARNAVNGGVDVARGIMLRAALAGVAPNAVDAGAGVARGMIPPAALAGVAPNAVNAGAGVAGMLVDVPAFDMDDVERVLREPCADLHSRKARDQGF